MAHAFLSPSGAPYWMLCNAKPWREKDLPDTSSAAADEGAEAHRVLEAALTYESSAAEQTTDAEMAAEVQKVLDFVRSHGVGGGYNIYAEQQLDISDITGEAGATGTADVVIVKEDELIVVDLKYGRGVQVFAQDNDQLAIYAQAALERFDVLGELRNVRMIIHQPRLNHVDEWQVSDDDLEARISQIRETAKRIALYIVPLAAVPGDKQCKFCKAKATCAEYREFVLGAVAGDFQVVAIDEPLAPQIAGVEERVGQLDAPRLANAMSALDMVEGWVKAVRSEVERRLLAGSDVPGYKLVEGRRGSRAWADAVAAEAAMKAMRLKVDEMYDLKVISPTSAEKLLAQANPRKWKKLQELITQSQGKPSVAPASDKRPALAMGNDFQVIEAIEDLV